MEEHFIYQSLFIICTLGSIICDDGRTHLKHFFSYDGSGDANFSCNGSDVINITDIQLIHHATDCPRNTCNLTDNDRKYIEKCNGNYSCEISIDHMNPCIKDRGFYSVDYSCQRNVMYCDFEISSCESFLEENDWNIITKAKNQNPTRDHTTGSDQGRYMYVKTGRDNKSFYSNQIHGSSKQCLTFYYYIHEHGSDSEDSMMLTIHHINGTTFQEVEILPQVNSDVHVLWERRMLSINDVSEYNFIIEARGHNDHSAFAVDDVSILNRDCPELRENVVYCDFEENSCRWFLDATDWGVGQLTDHTTKTDDGHCWYVMTGDSYKNFTSVDIPGSSIQCLTFYYYIEYIDDSLLLSIQHINGTIIEEVDIFRSVDSLFFWQRKTLSVKKYEYYKFIMEARGHHTESIFGVDDFSIINNDCTELKECDFETNYCNWIGSYSWRKRKEDTPSRNTGPSTDHTSGSGYYVYMEAENMYPNGRSYFISPTYSGKGEMCFVFWYYMYGSEMGSLRVYIELNRKRSKLLSISEDQGEHWNVSSIDIYADGEFILIIEGQAGQGTKSDIAIDDMSLLDGSCTGIVKNQQTCKSVDEFVELNECSNYYLSNLDVNFDPSKEFCSDILNQSTNPVCNNYGDNIICNASDLVSLRPSCFSLTSLVVGYTCTGIETLTLANKKSNDKDSTGVIVGGAVGLLLVVGVIVGVLYIIHRRRKLPGKGHNSNSKGDFPAAKCLKNRQTPNDGLSNSQTTVNPSYDQSVSITKPDESIKNKDIIYTNIQKQKGKTCRQDDYKVLDPAVTGFNRSKQNGYELASPINDTVDDNYAESVAGVYDFSGKSRHQVKDTIYDHSVDDTYDTSNRGRQEDLGDYTYNNVFGKQTEDEYDIAGS